MQNNLFQKKVCIFLLLAALSFLKFCSRKESEYLNFLRMFPYLTKGFNTQSIDFGSEDKRDEKYLLRGWSVPGTYQKNNKTFRWALGNKSTFVAYFTELSDKLLEMKCVQFKPPGQPNQVAQVYINGSFLQKLKFKKKQKYSFSIPSSTLNFGSNYITFKWKHQRSPRDFGLSNDFRKLYVRFFHLRFTHENQIIKQRERNNEILIKYYDNIPLVHVPSGGFLEYYVDLPEKSILKFGLYVNARLREDSGIKIAIYNQKGRRKIYNLKGIHTNRVADFRLKLKDFGKETVKIVFVNSLSNDQDFVATWVNPVIYSTSEKEIPLFWDIEKGDDVEKAPKAVKREAGKPNVFIYLVDTLRADHLSCYGYMRKTTPFIDEFSKEGILFKNCFANASWTKPAVASMLSGLLPVKHKAESRLDKLSSDVVTISEILKSKGYSTIYLTSNLNVSEVFNFNQGNDYYEEYYDSDYSSQFINSIFFRIIQNNADLKKKPIFAYLHTIDPHDPYAPTKTFQKFKKSDKKREHLGYKIEILKKKRQEGLSKEDIDFIVSLYDCEILQNDYYFGKFITFLKENDLYDNSIIVFLSDHGEQFNEHGSLFHGHTVYNEEIHIPLIIKFPGGEFSGKQSALFVSQVDILPTILEFLGIDVSPVVDGVSLLTLFKKESLKRSILIKENLDGYNFVSFIKDSEKTKHIFKYKDKNYIDVGSYEIYDLRRDFYEKSNLFADKGLFQLKSIKFKIDNFLAEIEKLATITIKKEKVNFKKMDPAVIQSLKALGYLK